MWLRRMHRSRRKVVHLWWWYGGGLPASFPEGQRARRAERRSFVDLKKGGMLLVGGRRYAMIFVKLNLPRTLDLNPQPCFCNHPKSKEKPK